MSKVIYVLSDNRSGSTLLDQLLGAHPRIVSLGEVHHLRAYALQDRRLYDPVHPLDCSCGTPVPSCPFWSSVQKRLGRNLATLRLKPRFLGNSAAHPSILAPLMRLPRHLVSSSPERFLGRLASVLYAARRVGEDSFALFSAIGGVTGADYLVDSSKSAFRFRCLYDVAPDRVFAIKLVRDYRATVYSKMKRGRPMEVAAREWAARVAEANRLTADLPRDRVVSLRYEDLCRDPQGELQRICSLLGIDLHSAMLSRPSVEVHHIGGSPSKFDPSRRKIELDQSYLTAFTDQQLAIIRDIVGTAAVDCGYA